MEVTTVRIQAYLRIVSDESRIRSIHEETNLPNASIKRLKSRRNAPAEETSWNWQTERLSIHVENPDEGLRSLLEGHKSIFPMIKKYQGPETDIYLEVVTQYEKADEPRGLYLSSETIKLLSEFGGALDNDVVPAIE